MKQALQRSQTRWAEYKEKKQKIPERLTTSTPPIAGTLTNSKTGKMNTTTKLLHRSSLIGIRWLTRLGTTQPV